MWIVFSQALTTSYFCRSFGISSVLAKPHEGDEPPKMVDLDDRNPPIPVYKEKQNEPLNLKKQR